MPNLNQTIFFLNREQEEQHTRDRAERLGIPYINLSNYPLVKEILDNIPEERAIEFQIIPYLKIGNDLKVGVVDPQNELTAAYIKNLEETTKRKLVLTLISRSSFIYGAYFYEKFRQEEQQKTDKKAEVVAVEAGFDITDLKSAAELAKKSTTTKLLDTLLVGAAKLNASDIHFEPGEDAFLTRYRVDGVLQDVVSLPLVQYHQLVSRIKFLAKLRMDMAEKPQDGRFSFDAAGEELDFRVSLMPSAFGESIVLRLLGQEKSVLKLDLLGFRPDALAEIQEAIHRPHGMVLTSGPTGSGKSSTLYAVITELKKPGVKIITLEDPVEYRIEGVEQSQVKPDAGYGFADGLRASLRQDPDILMVGEIRDLETAEIAVQAALTGHLLLSTIHANSAPAVYARLLDIGVKPFLLSGSINLIMAQRLVRQICPSCQENYSPAADVWQKIVAVMEPLKPRLSKELVAKLAQVTPVLVHGKGCDKCGQTGFTGRQVIVEILLPNETIETLISKKASVSEFEKAAVTMGMITMEQDGLVKALSGATTIEEVWRVTMG